MSGKCSSAIADKTDASFTAIIHLGAAVINSR
jgi:hypothetical protein